MRIMNLILIWLFLMVVAGAAGAEDDTSKDGIIGALVATMGNLPETIGANLMPNDANGGGDVIRDEAEEVRAARRRDLGDIMRAAGATEACHGKLLHEMSAECVETMIAFLSHAVAEAGMLIDEARRTNGIR